MRTSTDGRGRHRRRLSRLIPAAAAVLALVGGGIAAATSYAGQSDGGPLAKPPAGTQVASAEDEETTVKPFIIGGTAASQSWMVQLVYKDSRGSYFVCGGTLVAPTKVLTAAHCLHDADGTRQDWGKNGSVAVGSTESVTVSNAAKLVDVTRSWVRSGYDHDTMVNDIAVLTLAKPVAGPTLQMATPADTALYAPGTKGTVYGWGLTGSDGRTAKISPDLRKVELPIQSDTDCTENFNDVLGGGFQPGKMICTGPLATGNDATAKTTCPGDSGGPLVVNNRIVGVVSWGVASPTRSKVCNVAGTFEVFTKVSTYQPPTWPRVDDTDFTRDGRADLFLRTAVGGKGYVKPSTGSTFGASVSQAGSWATWDHIVQTDLDRDGYEDYLVRRKSDGALYWRHRTSASATYVNTKVYSGWKTRKFIVAPGDVTGDGRPDVLSTTSAGTLYLLPGLGNGKFGAQQTVGKGYQAFTALVGKGDFTGDGKADLVARGTSGTLHLLRGTGDAKAPFLVGVALKRSGANLNEFASPGDVTGDGRADLVARTPAGSLYLYPSAGSVPSETFATSTKISGSYKGYDIFS
ncbi:trypsin-like serine protease [Streptomyces sp. NPDC060194]|uniref:trypsin-like serine protease n=1 Tax=Streptomyces sp. NPDC060194 TaxID=3347069 RepID=UPI003653704D